MLWILHSETVQHFICAHLSYTAPISGPYRVHSELSYLPHLFCGSVPVSPISAALPPRVLSLSLLVLSSLDLDYRRTSLSMSPHPPRSHFLPQLFQSNLCYRTPSHSPSAPLISGSRHSINPPVTAIIPPLRRIRLALFP